jgi:CheY-like chemotaxis protein
MGKLFENYSQIESGADRKIEGTGLGLAITKQIVNMMDGIISVESEYGKGSCFTAKIVQALVDEDVIGEEIAENLRNFRYAAERETEKIDYLSLGGVQVLVVDDNIANLNVVRGLLAPYHITVDTAASGQEAIEKVKLKNYDMIFMDHMMPEMDGIETTAALRGIEDCAHTPIVALTANALQGMKEFYLENGFTDYLSKPLYSKALDEIIVKYLKEEGSREWGGGNAASGSGAGNVNINIAIEYRRYDMLNHFRAAFDSGRTIDTEYFKKFTTLLESLNVPDESREQLALLIEAGKREDAQTVRETLPAFCTAAQAAMAQEQRKKETGGYQNTLAEILPRLKDALKSGETKTAETILSELGPVKLYPAERELYFMLYDFLVKNNTEKALDVIYFWERLQDAWNKN